VGWISTPLLNRPRPKKIAIAISGLSWRIRSARVVLVLPMQRQEVDARLTQRDGIGLLAGGEHYLLVSAAVNAVETLDGRVLLQKIAGCVPGLAVDLRVDNAGGVIVFGNENWLNHSLIIAIRDKLEVELLRGWEAEIFPLGFESRTILDQLNAQCTGLRPTRTGLR
jgi:hypothetical protein